MHSIKIIGAGSIGNHLAHASRVRGWDVILTDIDPEALNRSKNNIYPSRYGSWDDAIVVKDSRKALHDRTEVVFIGTPPDSHIPLALEAIRTCAPKVLLIEKPLAVPDLSGCEQLLNSCTERGIFCAVGYNHCLGKNTILAEEILANGYLGPVQTISARTREHWQGILNAHPWLGGPGASYLGHSARGGGAAGEHSHAINIWQHFAHLLGAGRVVEISATLDRVKGDNLDYDQSAFLVLRTESGMVGDVIQDVVTQPTEKSARLQGESGFLEWKVNTVPGKDSVVFGKQGTPAEEVFIDKTRPDDFICEIDHLAEILSGRCTSSPISLERGLETMMVIAAAVESDRLGRRVQIDWDRGYTLDALR